MKSYQATFSPRMLYKTIKLWGLPGTGKTTKGVQLTRDYGCDETNLCAETFRVPLARDLREKLGFENATWVRTTHGICRRLLIRNGDLREVIEEGDRWDFCKQQRIPYKEYRNKPFHDVEYVTGSLGEALFSSYAYLVANLKPWNYWPYIPGMDQYSGVTDELVCSFFEEWEAYKQKKKKFDFSDMLRDCYELRLSPEMEVLFADEFQDKTPIQFALFQEWSKDAAYVIVAGDPYQCIYDFWGTTPDFYLNLEGAQEVLPRSYRLSQHPWQLAGGVLTQVGYVVPQLETNPGGIVAFLANYQQLEAIIQKFKYDNNFFLVRAQYMGHKFAQVLNGLGIPFKGIGEWSDKQIAIYNALLKLGQHEIAEVSPPFSFVSKVEGEALTAQELHALVDFFRADYFKVTKAGIKQQKGFFSPTNVYQLISPEIYKFAQGKYLPAGCMLARYPEHYYQKIVRALRLYGKLIPDQPLSYLGTIHSSKGREADNVFLFDNITHRIREQMKTDPQSEARVFFVGLTRARRALFVIQDYFRTLTYPISFPNGGSS